MTQPRDKLLVLDDSQLLAALRRPDIISAFPFLNALSTKLTAGKKKRCCGAPETVAANSHDLNGVRKILDQLAPIDKTKLCELLNTERIRVFYRAEDGSTVKSTWGG